MEHNKTKRMLVRAISLFTTCIFLISQITYANPGVGIEIAANREMPGFLRIDIPTELASLDGIWEAPPSADSRVVLHIQNAHANYGAQKKIQLLLEYLNRSYAIKTIFVEGAAEDLNPDYLKLFPDKERNVELADLLAQQGELTGAELYLLEADYGQKTTDPGQNKDLKLQSPVSSLQSGPVRGVGIEDAALYRQNYEALKKVFGAEALVNRYLQGYESRLEALSSKIFTNDLRRILADWQKFEKGHREFMPYIRSLAADAKRVLKLDLESLFSQVEWPQITRLLVLQGMEKELDTAKALEEKDKLISFLKDKGISQRIIAEVENFKEQRLSVRQGQGDMMQPRDVLEALIKEAGPKGFYFRDYPAFSLYAGYLILKSELDAKGLFEEIKVLFEKILDSLAVGSDQKTLIHLYRDEELARKLLHLELSRRDWKDALGRKTEVQMDSLISRLKDLSIAVTKEMKLAPSDLEVETLSPKFREQVLDLYGSAFSFYEFARQRESMFYEKINAVMGEGSSSKAVLITGGFHTDGMTDLFREHNVSYGVLTPRLMEKSDEKLYRNTMLQNEKQLFSISYLELANGATSLATRRDQGFDPAKELGDLIKVFRSKLPKELATGQGVADTFNNSAAAKAFGITIVFDAETSKAAGIDTYTIKGLQKFEGVEVSVARAEARTVKNKERLPRIVSQDVLGLVAKGFREVQDKFETSDVDQIAHMDRKTLGGRLGFKEISLSAKITKHLLFGISPLFCISGNDWKSISKQRQSPDPNAKEWIKTFSKMKQIDGPGPYYVPEGFNLSDNMVDVDELMPGSKYGAQAFIHEYFEDFTSKNGWSDETYTIIRKDNHFAVLFAELAFSRLMGKEYCRAGMLRIDRRVKAAQDKLRDAQSAILRVEIQRYIKELTELLSFAEKNDAEFETLAKELWVDVPTIDSSIVPREAIQKAMTALSPVDVSRPVRSAPLTTNALAQSHVGENASVATPRIDSTLAPQEVIRKAMPALSPAEVNSIVSSVQSIAVAFMQSDYGKNALADTTMAVVEALIYPRNAESDMKVVMSNLETFAKQLQLNHQLSTAIVWLEKNSVKIRKLRNQEVGLTSLIGTVLAGKGLTPDKIIALYGDIRRTTNRTRSEVRMSAEDREIMNAVENIVVTRIEKENDSPGVHRYWLEGHATYRGEKVTLGFNYLFGPGVGDTVRENQEGIGLGVFKQTGWVSPDKFSGQHFFGLQSTDVDVRAVDIMRAIGLKFEVPVPGALIDMGGAMALARPIDHLWVKTTPVGAGTGLVRSLEVPADSLGEDYISPDDTILPETKSAATGRDLSKKILEAFKAEGLSFQAVREQMGERDFFVFSELALRGDKAVILSARDLGNRFMDVSLSLWSGEAIIRLLQVATIGDHQDSLVPSFSPGASKKAEPLREVSLSVGERKDIRVGNISVNIHYYGTRNYMNAANLILGIEKPFGNVLEVQSDFRMHNEWQPVENSSQVPLEIKIEYKEFEGIMVQLRLRPRSEARVTPEQQIVAKQLEELLAPDRLETLMATTSAALRAMKIDESKLSTPALKVAVVLTQGILGETKDVAVTVALLEQIAGLVDGATYKGIVRQLSVVVPKAKVAVSQIPCVVGEVVGSIGNVDAFVETLKFNWLTNPEADYVYLSLAGKADDDAIQEVQSLIEDWARKINAPALAGKLAISGNAKTFQKEVAKKAGKNNYILAATVAALAQSGLDPTMMFNGAFIEKYFDEKDPVLLTAARNVLTKKAQAIHGVPVEKIGEVLEQSLKDGGIEKNAKNGYYSITEASLQSVFANLTALFEAFKTIAKAA